MKIVYLTDEGAVAVIAPTPEALAAFGIEAIAVKDVPTGKAFKFIADSELPSREDRAAWRVDPGTLTDGIGGESNEFPLPPEPPED